MSRIVITLDNEDLNKLANGEDIKVNINPKLDYSNLLSVEIRTDIKKDLIEVTRCRDCDYYISDSDMKNDPMFDGYENNLEADGLCINTDKWTDHEDYCSSATKKRKD